MSKPNNAPIYQVIGLYSSRNAFLDKLDAEDRLKSANYKLHKCFIYTLHLASNVLVSTKKLKSATR